MPNEESRPTGVVQTRSIDRVERSWDAGLEGRSIKARSVDGVEGCAADCPDKHSDGGEEDYAIGEARCSLVCTGDRAALTTAEARKFQSLVSSVDGGGTPMPTGGFASEAAAALGEAVTALGPSVWVELCEPT
jgi:hypothetical protein